MASKKPVNRPSIRHPSHNHPLRVFKAQEEDEIICSGCELDLTIGQAFKCTKKDCDYFLHKSCFDLPREINHKSHPDHPITLLYSPPYDHQSYSCDACGEYGTGFTYNCSECKYDVHVGCAFIPETVEHEDHKHPLTLFYKIPCNDGEMYVCDVCEEEIENLWTYYCKECNYKTHVHSCAVDEHEDDQDDYEPRKGGGGESSSAASRMKSMMRAQDEMAAMHLESRMKKAANNFIISSIR